LTIKGKRVGFLGAGNMGEAMIKGLLQAGLVPPETICATDVRAERLDQIARQYGVRAVAGNSALVSESDVVILAVKPQIMGAVLKEVAPAVDGRKLFISIAAGVATRTLREHLGNKPVRLIRVMPNTPALVLEGVTAIARSDGLEPGDLETAQDVRRRRRVVVRTRARSTPSPGLGSRATVIERSLADGK
jgi:pyrroline-5-carboxylate reductase